MRLKPIINGLLIEALALLIFLTLCQGAWASFEQWGGGVYRWGPSGIWVDLITAPTLLPSSVAFGSHATGTNTDSVLTLDNRLSTAPLQQASLTVAGTGFSLLSTTCGSNPFDVAILGNCTATVRFSPSTAGDKAGTCTLSAPNFTSLATSLTGTGTCTMPSAPTGVSAGSETSSGFTVSFTPGANSTSSSLDYGTTTGYGTTIAATSPQAITGLSASTLYHYRVNAINACGTTNGDDGNDTTTITYTAKDSITGTTTSPLRLNYDASSIWRATNFTPSSSYTVTRIDIPFYKIGSPTFNVTCGIYNSSSYLPTTIVGTASTGVSSSTAPGSEGTPLSFIGVSAAVTSGTEYQVVCWKSSGAGSDYTNYLNWVIIAGSVNQKANKSGDGSSWATDQSYVRHKFILYSSP